jgi:hypothetical protein
MPALSPVKKESVELGGSRMGTEENNMANAGRPCSGSATKKLKDTVIQNFFS